MKEFTVVLEICCVMLKAFFFQFSKAVHSLLHFVRQERVLIPEWQWHLVMSIISLPNAPVHDVMSTNRRSL